MFRFSDKAIVYYLPETTGWDSMFGGRPAVLWNPQVLTSDASFGVRAGQFGFTITGTSGLVIVVEASADLANPVWTPVGTNTLTGGSSYFSDPQWTNYPSPFLPPPLAVRELGGTGVRATLLQIQGPFGTCLSICSLIACRALAGKCRSISAPRRRGSPAQGTFITR